MFQVQVRVLRLGVIRSVNTITWWFRFVILNGCPARMYKLRPIFWSNYKLGFINGCCKCAYSECLCFALPNKYVSHNTWQIHMFKHNAIYISALQRCRWSDTCVRNMLYMYFREPVTMHCRCSDADAFQFVVTRFRICVFTIDIVTHRYRYWSITLALELQSHSVAIEKRHCIEYFLEFRQTAVGLHMRLFNARLQNQIPVVGHW